MISTSLAGSILQVASDLWADPGMRLIIEIAIGVPLAFLVIELIINAFRHPEDPVDKPFVGPTE